MARGDDTQPPPASARRQVTELDADAILRVLVAHEADFVVIGGFLVAFHGYVRATKDIDIVPNPAFDNLERLWRALTELDARPLALDEIRREELPVPFDFEGLCTGGNWDLRTTYGRLDILQWLAALESYDQLRARAVVAVLPNVGEVAFASYEDLVALKRSAGRDQDLIDLEALERARDED